MRSNSTSGTCWVLHGGRGKGTCLTPALAVPVMFDCVRCAICANVHAFNHDIAVTTGRHVDKRKVRVPLQCTASPHDPGDACMHAYNMHACNMHACK